MTKKKKYIAGILACLVIAAVLIGVWYQKNEGKGSRAVDGVYQRVVSADGSETSFHIAFDGGTMTYVQDMVVEGQSYTIDSGSYTVTDGIVQVYSETDDANSIAYVVDGDYIIARDFIYEGSIPETETFEAVVTHKGTDVTREVVFQKDGTYEETISTGEGSSEERVTKSAGTYTRDGKFIKRIPDSGEKVIDFYVYEDQVTNSYYEKTS